MASFAAEEASVIQGTSIVVAAATLGSSYILTVALVSLMGLSCRLAILKDTQVAQAFQVRQATHSPPSIAIIDQRAMQHRHQNYSLFSYSLVTLIFV